MNNLIGVNNCGLNKPSISKIHVFSFGEIGEYRYANDDLNFITKYTAANLPTTYRPNKKQSFYSGNERSGNFAFMNHQLTLSFPKLDRDKRREFKALKGLDLTLIFEDANGNSWIMGKNYPCKFKSLTLSTGAKDGENDYTLVFESEEKEQLKEIEAIDESCFSSVTVVENRYSLISFSNASALNYSQFDFSADDRAYNYIMQPVLNPNFWASLPNLKLSDELRLLSMFEAGGTITNFSANYDLISDTFTVEIESPNTSFGALIIDGISSTNTSVSAQLGFKVALSPNIANSNTSIELKDGSNNIIYSGDYDETLTGVSGVSGKTNDSIVIISNLYPNQDINLIFSLGGLDCPPFQYEYLHENTLSACSQSVDFQFYKGAKHKIFVPYVSFSNAANTGLVSPKFQDIKININGTFYEFYKSFELWHSDLTTFETDFKNKITESGFDLVDLNSMSFSDTGLGVEIDFFVIGMNADQKNPFFNSSASGESAPTNSQIGWIQSRALQLKTNAPVGSIVTHSDQYGNEINGDYLTGISDNLTFELLNLAETSNQSIENIALNYAFDNLPYSEISQITTSSVSSTCITPTLQTQLKSCFNGFNSTLTHTYVLATLDASTGNSSSGNVFEFTINGSTTVIVSPVAISQNENSHYLTRLFDQIKGVSLLAYKFNPVDMTYSFSFMVESAFNLTQIKELSIGRLLSLSSTNSIYTNSLSKKINPYIGLGWATLPTVIPFTSLGSRNLTIGEFQETESIQDVVSLTWNSTSGEVAISRLITSFPFSGKELTFDVYPWIDYPQNGVNSAYTFTLPSGTNSALDTGISAALGSLSNGGFVSYTDQFGKTNLKSFDFSSSGNLTFSEISNSPLIWGTVDYLQYLGTDITAQSPVESSLICSPCTVCVSSLAVTHSPIGNITTAIISVIGSAISSVASVQLSVGPTNGGSQSVSSIYEMQLISSTAIEKTFRAQNIQYSTPSKVLNYLYDFEFSFKDSGLVELLQYTENVEIKG
jgi:hypothetical protein